MDNQWMSMDEEDPRIPMDNPWLSMDYPQRAMDHSMDIQGYSNAWIMNGYPWIVNGHPFISINTNTIGKLILLQRNKKGNPTTGREHFLK